MGLFNSDKTLESRLAAAESALEKSIADLDAAVARAEAAEASVITLTAARDAALTQVTSEQEQGEAMIAAQGAEIRQALGIPDTTNLTAEVITAAIETKAGNRAVEIAAAQGVPPVPTKPSATGEVEDDVAADFAKAAAEPDPMKRAILFREASNRLSRGEPTGQN